MSKVNLKVFYEVEVKDKNGKLLAKHKGESKSLLRNFIACLRAITIGTPPPSPGTGGATDTVLDVTGTEQTIWGGWRTDTIGRGGGNPMMVNAPDDDDSYGIIVGTGSTAVTPENYSLASKIAHGTGTDQLDYGTHTFEEKTTSNNTSLFKVSRTFTNLSGASITVNELGIIARNYWADAGGTEKDIKFLILRDVLASPVSIPDGATLTVRYTFQVTA